LKSMALLGVALAVLLGLFGRMDMCPCGASRFYTVVN